MTDWEQLMNTPYRVPREKKARKIDITSEAAKLRYQQAHEHNFKTQYPSAYQAGHYFKPKMPNCSTSNGLQQAIIKFLLWNGHRATRVSSAGRMIKGKYIPGSTRKGASDISATVYGKSLMLEIKIGADTPSDHQLREQELEQKAGGVYEFVKTFEEFLKIYDEQTNQTPNRPDNCGKESAG